LEKKKINKYNLVFAGIIAVFLAFTIYLAFSLRIEISPDSWYHIRVSQAYATTLTIPQNTPDTYQWRDISHIPYLYFWINARIINFNDWILHTNVVILLRLINVIYAFLTVIGVFLVSKEVFKNKWVRLIPMVLVTNTLMFLLLSSSLNYDNLVNLFSVFSILYFIRVLKDRKNLTNILMCILMICLGALTKFTFMPLAFILVFLLAIDYLRNRKAWSLKLEKNQILLLLPVLVSASFAGYLYGSNIIKYHELTPSCEKVLTYEQCLANGAFYRNEITIPAVKVDLAKMISSGERYDPISYTVIWIWAMTQRTIGIMGDSSMYPPKEVTTIFAIFITVTSILGVRNWKSLSHEVKYLAIVSAFYLGVLMVFQNYYTYLKHGNPVLALQGRYMFPVISSLYVSLTAFILSIKGKKLRYVLIILAIAGMIIFAIPYFLLNVDSGWFAPINY